MTRSEALFPDSFHSTFVSWIFSFFTPLVILYDNYSVDYLLHFPNRHKHPKTTKATPPFSSAVAGTHQGGSANAEGVPGQHHFNTIPCANCCGGAICKKTWPGAKQATTFNLRREAAYSGRFPLRQEFSGHPTTISLSILSSRPNHSSSLFFCSSMAKCQEMVVLSELFPHSLFSAASGCWPTKPSKMPIGQSHLTDLCSPLPNHHLSILSGRWVVTPLKLGTLLETTVHIFFLVFFRICFSTSLFHSLIFVIPIFPPSPHPLPFAEIIYPLVFFNFLPLG